MIKDKWNWLIWMSYEAHVEESTTWVPVYQPPTFTWVERYFTSWLLWEGNQDFSTSGKWSFQFNSGPQSVAAGAYDFIWLILYFKIFHNNWVLSKWIFASISKNLNCSVCDSLAPVNAASLLSLCSVLSAEYV